MKKSTLFLTVLVLILAHAIFSLYSSSPIYITQDTYKNDLDKALKLNQKRDKK